MKKTLAILLALVLAFSLVACAKDNGGSDTPSASNDPSNASPSASQPDESSAPPSPTSTELSGTAVAGENEVGTINEIVDHQARRKYKIAYAHVDNNLLEQQMYEAYLDIADKYNFEIVRMSGDTDDEKYITSLETLIDRGDIDGFIIETTNSVQNAVLDLMDACKIPYINQFTEYFDADGRVVTPTVGIPQWQTGYVSTKYLIDHYEEYWGKDLDTSEFGLITIDFSVSPALNDRVVGAEDAFKEAFPGNNNIFYNDSFAAGQSAWFTLEGGYDPTAQTIGSHPEVKYWFVSACVENYSQGAARAAEDLNRNDSMLITDVGHPMLKEEWDNGYDGAWICAVAISNYAYATPVALGLIALIDGRATAETLWPEYKKEGDKCAVWYADFQVVTKDNYQQYLADVDAKYGP